MPCLWSNLRGRPRCRLGLAVVTTVAPWGRNDGHRPQRWRSVVVLLLALVAGLSAQPVGAEELAAESQYRAGPAAHLAESAARHWLAKGQLARAINWVERMVRSPGATADQGSWASKVRGELKWKLGDLGYAPLEVRVRPALALVTLDGRELLPRTGNHVVWVAEGGHQVQAEAVDFTTFEQVVAAVRNERQAVEIELVSVRLPTLLVAAHPPCEVWIDGNLVGSSQRGEFSVTPGSHVVEFRLKGYLSSVQAIDVALGGGVKLQARLQLVPKEGQGPRGPSDVKRDVTEGETVEAGEAGPNIAHAPEIDSPLDGKPGGRVQVSRGVAKGPAVVDRKGSVGGAAGRAPEPEAAGGWTPSIDKSDGGTASPGWSGSHKGLLVTVPGLLALAGGAFYTIKATQAAEKVNQDLAYGDPGYDSAYAAAAKQTYTGYGIMGAGAVMTVWGATWLLGRDGLSRPRKGALITVTGMAAAAAGGYLYTLSDALRVSAGGFTAQHPEYQRRVNLAKRDRSVAFGVAGAGVAVAAVGLWQWLGGSSRSAVAPAQPARQLAVTPVWTPAFSGAVVQATW